MTSPPAFMDRSRRNHTAAAAAAHASGTGQRSAHGSRLANSHQTARAAAPIMGPRNQPKKWAIVSGATQAGTRMTSHWSAIMTTPGQRRGRGSAADERGSPMGDSQQEIGGNARPAGLRRRQRGPKIASRREAGNDGWPGSARQAAPPLRQFAGGDTSL